MKSTYQSDVKVPVASKKTMGKQKKSSKPRRPHSAYNVFSSIERTEIIREQQLSSGTDEQRDRARVGFANCARIMSERWKTVDDEYMKELEEKARLDQIRYERDMSEWKSKHDIKNKVKQLEGDVGTSGGPNEDLVSIEDIKKSMRKTQTIVNEIGALGYAKETVHVLTPSKNGSKSDPADLDGWTLSIQNETVRPELTETNCSSSMDAALKALKTSTSPTAYPNASTTSIQNEAVHFVCKEAASINAALKALEEEVKMSVPAHEPLFNTRPIVDITVSDRQGSKYIDLQNDRLQAPTISAYVEATRTPHAVPMQYVDYAISCDYAPSYKNEEDIFDSEMHELLTMPQISTPGPTPCRTKSLLDLYSFKSNGPQRKGAASPTYSNHHLCLPVNSYTDDGRSSSFQNFCLPCNSSGDKADEIMSNKPPDEREHEFMRNIKPLHQLPLWQAPREDTVFGRRSSMSTISRGSDVFSSTRMTMNQFGIDSCQSPPYSAFQRLNHTDLQPSAEPSLEELQRFFGLRPQHNGNGSIEYARNNSCMW